MKKMSKMKSKKNTEEKMTATKHNKQMKNVNTKMVSKHDNAKKKKKKKKMKKKKEEEE